MEKNYYLIANNVRQMFQQVIMIMVSLTNKKDRPHELRAV